MKLSDRIKQAQDSVSTIGILPLTLRGSSVLGKFALLMCISKYGELADLGVYGIFVSSVMLLNYIQGISFTLIQRVKYSAILMRRALQ